MPILGATAPITIAGRAVINNAELVSGAALVQLAFPGAKIIHGGGPTGHVHGLGRLRQQLARGPMLRGIQGQMADFYGSRPGSAAGATRPRSRACSPRTRTRWR